MSAQRWGVQRVGAAVVSPTCRRGAALGSPTFMRGGGESDVTIARRWGVRRVGAAVGSGEFFILIIIVFVCKESWNTCPVVPSNSVLP